MKSLIPKYQKGSALDIDRMKADFLANSDYVKHNKEGVAYLSREGKKVLSAMKELEASHLKGQLYDYNPITENYKVFNPLTGEVSKNSGLDADGSRINLNIFDKEKRQSHRLNKTISKLVPKYVTSQDAIEDLVLNGSKEEESEKEEKVTTEEEKKKDEPKKLDPVVSLGLLNAIGATPFLSTVIPTPSILDAKEKDKKEKESLTTFLSKPKVESPKVQFQIKTKEEVEKEKEKAEKEKLKLTGSFAKDALNVKSVNYKFFNPTKKFKQGGQLVTKHQSLLGPTVLPNYNFNRPSSLKFSNDNQPNYTPFNKIKLTTTPTNLGYNNNNPFKKSPWGSDYGLLGNQKRFAGALTGTDYNEQLLKFKAEENQKLKENETSNLNTDLSEVEKRGLISRFRNVNLSGVKNFAPLAINTLGNAGQLWAALKSSKDPIGSYEPPTILNANRVAVQDVAPVQSLFTENFNKEAGAFRNTYAGSDPALSMISGNLAQAQRQEVLGNKAEKEGLFLAQQRQDFTNAENLVKQAHVANLNSDTATLNANNAAKAQAEADQLQAEKERKEFRYKAIGDFLGNTLAGIGGQIQANRQFGATKGMTDLALKHQELQQMKAANAYLASQGRQPMDMSTQENEYKAMDEAFKRKYNLG